MMILRDQDKPVSNPARQESTLNGRGTKWKSLYWTTAAPDTQKGFSVLSVAVVNYTLGLS